MQLIITLTLTTDDVSPTAWPDETVEVGAVVSILTETGDEILGRVVGIRYERVDA